MRKTIRERTEYGWNRSRGRWDTDRIQWCVKNSTCAAGWRRDLKLQPMLEIKINFNLNQFGKFFVDTSYNILTQVNATKVLSMLIWYFDLNFFKFSASLILITLLILMTYNYSISGFCLLEQILKYYVNAFLIWSNQMVYRFIWIEQWPIKLNNC